MPSQPFPFDRLKLSCFVALAIFLVCAAVGYVYSDLSAAESLPRLEIKLLPDSKAQLSWTNSATNFVVQQTPTAAVSSIWDIVSQSPVLNGGLYSVVLSNQGPSRFFRLHLPTSQLPPDPSVVAPPVSKTTATDMATATSFLYSGANPIQSGVTNGTIEPRRVAVLRGKVTSRDNTALSGVRITVLGHPEFGQTLSRADGAFDLAVNGGGQLTVRYEKEGFLAAQRAIVAPWRDYTWLPDVVMVQFDTAVTAVDLTVANMQVARGSAITDADGSRRATILFPQGISAGLVMPNGTTQTVSSLNIRATEYTIASNGPAAMPANLPPSSGYTYCVELSADEAVAAGAIDVRFNQALPVYVENFLDFPVGTAVPTGYYDRQKGQWIASANGRVIKVLSITDGMADLDLNGDTVTDNTAALVALGVTNEERSRLAQLYGPAQSLWRVPITHFTPWDCNWPYGPPPDAISPPDPRKNDPPVDDPNEECGSVIGIEAQTLGESLPVTGTPFRLHYRSNRTPGRKDLYTVNIPLSGATTLPSSLRAIRVEVTIAGRSYWAAFVPTPNLSYTVIWDGNDGYGRPLQGAQDAGVQVHYDYAPKYYAVPSDFVNSFARAAASGAAVSASRVASTISLSKMWTRKVGNLGTRAVGLGGWNLSVQHAYDHISRTLLLGDGQQRRAEALSLIITTVAGNGTFGSSGDGGPATAAQLGQPFGVAVGPDGSLFIVDRSNERIRRVGPDGIITTVAGNGTAGFSGDGGPAVAATLNNPVAIAVGSESTLFIVDRNNQRIRRVGPDGIITTVAGNGTLGFNGDGPAVAAALHNPVAVAVGSDGSLFIADGENRRIRRVGPDGLITTVAGDGNQESISVDGGPATATSLCFPVAVAAGSGGNFFIADLNHRIRRVAPDGIITTAAGNGHCSFSFGDFSGDGGLATTAQLSTPYSVAVGQDGSLFIADRDNQRIRRVGADGIITTIAGNGSLGFAGDGGQATAAVLNNPVGIAVGPDGSLFIADRNNRRVRRIRPAMPDFAFADSDVLLASEDARELYTFNSVGRHLKTVDALTGAVRYEFSYDADGYLTSVTDVIGNVTTVERSGAAPTAIIAPGGQRTTLAVNTNGWVIGLTNSAHEAHTMSYSADGLLQQFIDPRGNTNTFTYDALGRLIKDEDAVGGSTTLNRTEQANGYTVTTTSALGRSRVYQVEQLPTGSSRRTVTEPSGAKTVRLINTDATEETTYPDGDVATVQYGPDPRWGMLAPVASRVTLKTPGGLTRTVTTTRTAGLSNPSNLLSLTNLTDTVTNNGAVSTSVYDGTLRSLTLTTPAGRRATFDLDTQGRLTREQFAELEPTSYMYDSRGFLNTIAEGSGLGLRTNRFAFSGAGYATNVTDPLGHSLLFTYDAAGRVTTQTLPDDRVINLAYDANGNLTSLTPPGRPDHTFQYSAADLMTRYEPPAVVPETNFTLYTYDVDRQLTVIKQPDREAVHYGYSATNCNCGRLASLIHARGTNIYNYDPVTDNLIGVKAPGGSDIAFAYDGGLLTSEVRSGPLAGIVSNSYDSRFRLISQDINNSASVSFQYDLDSLVTRVGDLALTRNADNGFVASTALGHVTNTWAYNGFGEVTNASAVFNATAVYEVRFIHDQAGRMIQKTETIDGVTDQYIYNYDLVDRLASVVKNGAPAASYAYDSNDNRLTVTTAGGAADAIYDAQDRLIQYGAATYTYTDSGDLSSRNVAGQITSYDYDALGSLIAVTLPNATQIEYLIDGFNRRIGKKVNGSVVQGFLYDGALRVAELDGLGDLVSRFVYGTRGYVPDYMIKGGVTYQIINDHVGSPRLIVNVETGDIVQRIDYDEFGNVLRDTNPGFQPFGFAGGLYDTDTKLVRFGARDYDAETGRWTAKDPIGFDGGLANLYAYVGNDPVNLHDPTGLKGSKLVVTLLKPVFLKPPTIEVSLEPIVLEPKLTVWLEEPIPVKQPKLTVTVGEPIFLEEGGKCKGSAHKSKLRPPLPATPKTPRSRLPIPTDDKPTGNGALFTSGAATRT